MTTAIVTDSTTSLSPEILERPDVRMVPLSFHFGADETYTDKIDLSDEAFYEKLSRAEEFPTTSQPPAGAFVEAYESLSAYDDILVLTISLGLSGTYDSAVAAADMVDGRVEVLDTRSAEMGSGLILREALRVIDDGGDFDDVRQASERAIHSCQIFFAVGTLEYLAKSGRIGRAQRLVGTALNVRPVLKVENGEVVPHKRARGRNRQMAVIIEQAKPAVDAGKTLYFGHIAAQEQSQELCEKLGIDDPLTATLGGVVGAHVGPGAYGLAYL
ncbi:MAG: DegV family protein [Rubrobacteraceae bacterium]